MEKYSDWSRMDLEHRKSLLVAGTLFLCTLGWIFFLDQLALTPDSLLRWVGKAQEFGLLIQLPFAGFAVLFSLAMGIIVAYADRDERGKVYIATLVPSILACGVSIFLFSNFAQWYPLALFYFGSIPLMIETSRIKRLELKNFVVPRSNFSGIQKGMQVMGIGVLVTLSIVAFPQNEELYKGFEDNLFQGKIVQQVNVEKITADFLISTQRNTIIQIIESEQFTKLREKDDPEATSFVTLMDETLVEVNSPGYREKVVAQAKSQQKKINPQDLVKQLEQTVPGYNTLHDNFWLVTAALGALFYFLVAVLIIQPLGAVAGTILYAVIPEDGYSFERSIKKTSNEWTTPSSTRISPTEELKVEGWKSSVEEHPTDISAKPEETPQPIIPEYTHTEETPGSPFPPTNQ